MSTPIYTDPRLAAVYEALNAAGADDAFYLDLAGAEPRAILDVGCGTGRLACLFAARGHSVTGVEPSAAMLDIARARCGAEGVTWINTPAAELSLETRFDLIVMTGHVFQVFLPDAEISSALRNLHYHLSPKGQLAFESRNPLSKKWEHWTPAETARTVDVPGFGDIHVHHATGSVGGELVTYETHFVFPNGDHVTAADTLRFVGRDHLAELLTDSGFSQVIWYGDWDGSPFTPASPEIIAVAVQ